MTIEDLLFGLRLNWLAVVASILVAATCGFLGVWVVLKRIVFVGVSLAQISSAGIALAFMLGPSLALAAHRSVHALPPFNGLSVCLEWLAVRPMVVSLSVTLLAISIFARQSSGRRVPRDAVIGIGYVIASALTLLFILRSAKGMDDVRELLDGSVIAVRSTDLVVMAAVYACVALVHMLFHKQLLFVSFDPEMAASRGYRVQRWEMLLFLTLGATIAVSIQQAGLLSVFALMVLPATTGLVSCRRMSGVFAVAVAAAVLSAVAGFALALLLDTPVSPPTIGAGVALLLSACVWRRLRA